MRTPFVLVPYPISQSYTDALQAVAGEPLEVLDLPRLRRLGQRGLLRELWARRGQPCFVAFEHEGSLPLLPAMRILGAAAGPRTLTVVRPDLTSARVSRARAVADTVEVVRESIRLRHIRGRAAREVADLLVAPRIDLRRAGSSVVYLNANLWFGIKAGGSLGHTSGVLNALYDRGVHVELATLEPPPLLRSGIRIVHLPVLPGFGLPVELNAIAFSRASARQLAARLRTTPPGFLLQRVSLGSYAGAVVSRAARVPLVVEYNGSEPWIARHWSTPVSHEQLAADVEAVLLRHAHLCVAVSSVLGAELEERGVEPRRIVVAPNGVDPDLFDPARLTHDGAAVRQRLGLTRDEVVVMFVGTFGRWHGAEVLGRAIRLLAESDPEWLTRQRVRFVLVGDGVGMTEAQSSLGAAGRAVTTCTGLVPQADAPAYLAASDLLVSPHVPNADGTPFFGSPTKLYEYMAMSRGVVASALGQIGETLTPALHTHHLPERGPDRAAELAVLAPPGDVEALSRGIRFLVDRRDWRVTLGANARRRVLERHTWAIHVDAILDRLAAVVPSAGRA
jgi:glycosyltransferase involved in cell wall biosynthesis